MRHKTSSTCACCRASTSALPTSTRAGRDGSSPGGRSSMPSVRSTTTIATTATTTTMTIEIDEQMNRTEYTDAVSVYSVLARASTGYTHAMPDLAEQLRALHR